METASDTSLERRARKVSVVIPVYNSAASIRVLVDRLVEVMQRIHRPFEIVLVDDCSQDEVWSVLKKAKADHGDAVRIARLLTNSGQHNAILCGFSLVTGDVVVTMDDDLQNPPEEVPKLIEAIDQGYDLVIGAYDSKKHNRWRNLGGRFVDFLQRRIFRLPRDFQLTSFRAMRRAVANRVGEMGGVFPYITSMAFSHASKYTNVAVRHEPRPFGKSNYGVKRSISLSANLIFHYSSYPLYFVGGLCFAALLFSMFFGGLVLIQALVFGSAVPGWASTIVIVSFFNTLVLACLLVFGFYLSRFNHQLTRSRVNYTIEELHE